MGFPSSSGGRESAYNVGDLDSSPGLGRSPRRGHGNSLQYSWRSLELERSLVGYSPWMRKESDMTERLSTAQHNVNAVQIVANQVLFSELSGILEGVFSIQVG